MTIAADNADSDEEEEEEEDTASGWYNTFQVVINPFQIVKLNFNVMSLVIVSVFNDLICDSCDGNVIITNIIK